MAWSVSDIPDQHGKIALVTGCGGLGFEDGLALARAGATVIFGGRSAEKGQAAVARVQETVSSANVRFELVDLASLDSIEECAGRLLCTQGHLDLLINNAGIMMIPERCETKDRFELQFGTNHLGHFALTARLMPLLLKSEAPRVVSLSSNFYRQGAIDFEDLHGRRKYSSTRQYSQSKLATLMFAFELDRRARAAQVSLISNAAHPGFARTDLVANGPGARGLTGIITTMLAPFLGQSAADGALATLYAATAPETAHGGGYYGPTKAFEMRGPPGVATLSRIAQDEVVAKRLWEVSAKLTRVEPQFA